MVLCCTICLNYFLQHEHSVTFEQKTASWQLFVKVYRLMNSWEGDYSGLLLMRITHLTNIYLMLFMARRQTFISYSAVQNMGISVYVILVSYTS